MSEFTEEQRFRFEQRLKLVRAVGFTRHQEQKRVADHIELLMFDANSPEVCEALLSVALVLLGEKP